MQSITCFSEERASIYAHMLAFLHQKLGTLLHRTSVVLPVCLAIYSFATCCDT